MSEWIGQLIDTFVVPEARVAEHLSEEVGARAGGRRIVALSTIPNAVHPTAGRGVAVVLVTEGPPA
jgi:hypothetical protein